MRNTMMIKEFALTLLLFIGVIGVLVYPHSAAAISLKGNTIISDNTIKLSDIFTGLPAQKDKVLGPAPLPGKDMVLNARTLLRIAVALDLPWRPEHPGEHVVLSRAATVIDTGMIEDALKSEMSAHGVSGDYKIAFSGPLSQIILPMDKTPGVEVQSFNFHQGQDRFEAVLVAPSKSAPLETLRVSGTVQRLIEVPVLRETLRQGTVIGKRDIEMTPIMERDLDRDTALRAEDVIGMTPRGLVMAGKPLSMKDLEAPQIVGRGDVVVMTYANKGMSLSAQAKALENGAKGDVIRVSNLSSSRTLTATVTGEREVTVMDF